MLIHFWVLFIYSGDDVGSGDVEMMPLKLMSSVDCSVIEPYSVEVKVVCY